MTLEYFMEAYYPNQAVVMTPEIYGVFDIDFNQGLNFYC